MRAGRAIPVALALLALALTVPSTEADGTLPAQPYHYLHPPPALAGSNTLPSSGTAVASLANGKTRPWHAFTADGQAGIVMPAGAFSAPPGAKSVRIEVRPVEPPSGLPTGLGVDGNAYSFTVMAQPGGGPVEQLERVNLVLRWPHIPSAIYEYRNGAWKQLCYSDTAILTPSTVSCPAASMGIFAAVASASVVGGGAPTVPVVSSSPYAWMTKYIPVAAAVLVIVAAAVAGYFVSRPDREAE